MDLEIRYRPGQRNSSANALSRSPLSADCEDSSSFRVISVLQDKVDARGREEKLPLSDSPLATEQCKDPELSELITYLESGKLPAAELKAR